MSVVVTINTSLSIKLGDYGFAYTLTLYTPNGDGTYTLKDLTSVTTATLKVYRAGGAAAVLLTKTLTILSPPTNGQVQYLVAQTDTTTLGVGAFLAEVQLTATGYQESTLDPFQYQVGYGP
jgi:hypothetical protein